MPLGTSQWLSVAPSWGKSSTEQSPTHTFPQHPQHPPRPPNNPITALSSLPSSRFSAVIPVSLFFPSHCLPLSRLFPSLVSSSQIITIPFGWSSRFVQTIFSSSGEFQREISLSTLFFRSLLFSSPIFLTTFRLRRVLFTSFAIAPPLSNTTNERKTLQLRHQFAP